MFEENVVCKLLQIKYPIFQGGMAWLGTAELASAVSNAGGLGIIGAGHMPPDVLRAEIQKTKAATDKPFGVNIMLMSPFVKELMQVVVEERVPVVTTGAGNPGEYIPALKAIGSKVIPVVASVALAKRLARTGVDAIIAEGMESGGHIGEIATLPLVPQVVDAVEVPVIAAGGIITVLIRNVAVLQFGMPQAAGSFLGAAVVGLLALRAIHIFHTPNIVLTIPSALMNIRTIDSAALLAGLRSGVEAITIIIAIAVGVAIPNIFIHRYIERNKQQMINGLLARRYENEG